MLLQVGLVIDLTNTTRFYDAAEWSTIGEGIQYIKVAADLLLGITSCCNVSCCDVPLPQECQV